MAKRLHDMGVAKYRNGFKVTMYPDQITEPFISPVDELNLDGVDRVLVGTSLL